MGPPQTVAGVKLDTSRQAEMARKLAETGGNMAAAGRLLNPPQSPSAATEIVRRNPAIAKAAEALRDKQSDKATGELTLVRRTRRRAQKMLEQLVSQGTEGLTPAEVLAAVKVADEAYYKAIDLVGDQPEQDNARADRVLRRYGRYCYQRGLSAGRAGQVLDVDATPLPPDPPGETT